VPFPFLIPFLSSPQAIIKVAMQEPLSTTTLMSILDTVDSCKPDRHLGVEDCLRHVRRYRMSFEEGSVTQTTVTQFEEIAIPAFHNERQSIQDASGEAPPFVFGVLVKPPETIAIMMDCRSGTPSFILFDSHRRDAHEGAAFLRFSNGTQLCRYLSFIFPSVDMGDAGGSMYGFQSQMLNMVEVAFLRPRDGLRTLMAADRTNAPKVRATN
jgi:hypothetical protein